MRREDLTKKEFRELVEHDSRVQDRTKRQTIEDEKQEVRKKLNMTLLEHKEEKLSLFDKLQIELQKSGIDKNIADALKQLLRISVIVFGVLAIVFFSYIIGVLVMPVGWVILIILGTFLIGFPAVYGAVFMLYRLRLQVEAFSRRIQVEQVLPQFLRLVAINHRSGLNLDAALLQSNRKSFGLLSNEIEYVIKESRITGDLAGALESMGQRFDSKLLEQTFKSLALSVRNGSNVSQMLDDIVDNINSMRLLQKNLVANVKNYIIFIIIAGLIIMPFMLALSAQMNATISDIKDDFEGIDLSESQLSMLNIGEEGGTTPQNFLVYVILLLTTNSLFVALLMSAIRYGNIKQNLKRIPQYLVLSFAVYFISSGIISLFFG